MADAERATGTGTAVGRDPFDDDPADLVGRQLTTAGIAEMLPGVLPPLVWCLNRHVVEEAFRRLLDGLGALPPAAPAEMSGGPSGPQHPHGGPDRADPCRTGNHSTEPYRMVRRIRGRAALDFTTLRDAAAAMGGSTGADLERQLLATAGDHPTGPDAPPAVAQRRTIAHQLRTAGVRSRAVLDADVCIGVARLLHDTVPPALDAASGRALAARLTRLTDLAVRAAGAELTVAADAAALEGRLEQVLARHLHAAGATALAERLTADVPPPGIAARASAAVFAGPTWDELGLPPAAPPARRHGAGPHASGDGPGQPDPTEIARAALGPAAAGLRGRIRLRTIVRLAADTTEQLARREATKAALLLLGGEVRRTALAAGALLHAGGALAATTDVELLAPAELLAALRGGPTPAPAVLEQRRVRYRSAQDRPALPTLFTGWPEPAEHRAPTSDITLGAGPAGLAPGTVLSGRPAAHGVATGRARVAHSPLDELDAGDIVIASTTDPSWTPLLLQAAAIVLEGGGPLAHAAVLAREAAIPAVVDLAGATELLDGRRVRVDGGTGTVELLADDRRDDGAARS